MKYEVWRTRGKRKVIAEVEVALPYYEPPGVLVGVLDQNRKLHQQEMFARAVNLWRHGISLRRWGVVNAASYTDSHEEIHHILPKFNTIVDLRTLELLDDVGADTQPVVLGLPGLVDTHGIVVQGDHGRIDWFEVHVDELLPGLKDVRVAIDEALERGLA